MILNERHHFLCCSYDLWFNLCKSVQAVPTGAFPPKSRAEHLTYFASLAPGSSEPGLSSLFHLQPVWAVWLWSLFPLSKGGTEWTLLYRNHTFGTLQHTWFTSFPQTHQHLALLPHLFLFWGLSDVTLQAKLNIPVISGLDARGAGPTLFTKFSIWIK